MSCHTQRVRTDWPRRSWDPKDYWLKCHLTVEQTDNGRDCWLLDIVSVSVSVSAMSPANCVRRQFISITTHSCPPPVAPSARMSGFQDTRIRCHMDTCLQLSAWPLIIGRPLLIIAQLLASVIQLGHQTMMLNRLPRVECLSRRVGSRLKCKNCQLLWPTCHFHFHFTPNPAHSPFRPSDTNLHFPRWAIISN